jgi:predicted DNA-binding protein
MPRKASTHRLEPDVQAGLNYLSKVLHRPKNKLMNEAVSRFVQERSIQLVQEMEGVINSLKEYQRSDPDFERAIERLVNDEVAQAGADPLEGRPAGAVQAEIRGLLHA